MEIYIFGLELGKSLGKAFRSEKKGIRVDLTFTGLNRIIREMRGWQKVREEFDLVSGKKSTNQELFYYILSK